MPTIGPEPARVLQGEPHRRREMAESFGSDPERYDRVRPGYPEELVAAVVAAAPGVDVLDVGIGTGIAARQFRAAGCRVLGVEVDGRMAEFARRGGFAVEVARFEHWDPAGREFDAVVAGQTWHWVDPDAGAAKAAQALRPGGRLAVFWNVFRPPPAVAEAFSAVYRRALDGYDPWAQPALDGYSRILTRVSDGIGRSDAFGDPERWRFDWARSYTRQEWLEQMATGGDVARIPPATLAELQAGVGAAIDAFGGSFTMEFAAVVVTAARRSASGSVGPGELT